MKGLREWRNWLKLNGLKIRHGLMITLRVQIPPPAPYTPVAQQSEPPAHNGPVGGANPSWGTNKKVDNSNYLYYNNRK